MAPTVEREDPLRFGPLPAWLGAVVFLAIGVFCMVLGGSWCLDYRRSQTWPAAPATVESVERDENTDGFRIRCTYRFTFDGHEHRSSRISITGQGVTPNDSGNAEYAAKLDELQRCRDTATPTTCYVNPRDPTRSILLRRCETRMWGLPVAGLAFAAWAPMFPFLYYRSVRQPSA